MTSYHCDGCAGETFALRDGNTMMSEIEALDGGMTPEVAGLASALELGILARCTSCGLEVDVVDLVRGPVDVIASGLRMAGALAHIEQALVDMERWFDTHPDENEDQDDDDPIGDFIERVERAIAGSRPAPD